MNITDSGRNRRLGLPPWVFFFAVHYLFCALFYHCKGKQTPLLQEMALPSSYFQWKRAVSQMKVAPLDMHFLLQVVK